jgi:hypothetical protein
VSACAGRAPALIQTATATAASKRNVLTSR